MAISKDLLELAREAGRDLAQRARESAGSAEAITVARDAGTIDHARQSAEARRASTMIRMAASASFVKELAKMCGKAGAAGAAVDGAVGGFRAAKYVRQGAIDRRQALKHVGAEAGCGFVTSSSGTAGTLAVFMVTGSMGPAALAAGMGASMGSRYLYKQAVGETLPDEEELEERADSSRAERGSTDGDPTSAPGPAAGSDIRDIGPHTPGAEESGESGFEPIGPDEDATPEEPSAVEDDRSADDPGDAASSPDSGDAPSEASDSPDSDEDDSGGGDVWESIGPDA